MRLLTFAQIVFLAILFLYVAVKSNDRLEYSWDATKIDQARKSYASMTDIDHLVSATADLMEKAGKRLLARLEDWYSRQDNIAGAGKVDLSGFHRSLADRGEGLYYQAANLCIDDGIARISDLADSGEHHLRNIRSMHDFYQRLVAFSLSDKMTSVEFAETLGQLRQEVSCLQNEDIKSSNKQIE